MRIANRQVRQHVTQLKEFTTHNGTIYAKWIGQDEHRRYVVYSYGPHFPMYIYTGEKWFGNKDKYSQTTSCHQSHARPSVVDEWYDTDTMQAINMYGIVNAVKQRLGGVLCT